MSDIAAVHTLIDALAALDAPRPDDVARALGIPMPLLDSGAAVTEHRGTFPSGPLASITVRYQPRWDAGLVVAEARREDAGIAAVELDTGRWGPIIDMDLNPSIPPEGADSHRYVLRRTPAGLEVNLAIQFGHGSGRLRLVSMSWEPARTRGAGGPP